MCWLFGDANKTVLKHVKEKVIYHVKEKCVSM